MYQLFWIGCFYHFQESRWFSTTTTFNWLHGYVCFAFNSIESNDTMKIKSNLQSEFGQQEVALKQEINTKFLIQF